MFRKLTPNAVLMAASLGVTLTTLSAPSRADDFAPPNWRGSPGTTWVQWEFLTNNTTPQYDNGFLPYGPPTILVTPGTGAGWHATQPTAATNNFLYNPEGVSGDGWWNLSGEIDLTLQNSPVHNPHKEVWIQLTWEPQAPGDVPVIQITDPLGPETNIPLVDNIIWQQDPSNTWRAVHHTVYHLDISPNPSQESIRIRGGINVDELVIDTWCVPEPASASMLGAPAFLYLLRRKRRAK